MPGWQKPEMLSSFGNNLQKQMILNAEFKKGSMSSTIKYIIWGISL